MILNLGFFLAGVLIQVGIGYLTIRVLTGPTRKRPKQQKVKKPERGYGWPR